MRRMRQGSHEKHANDRRVYNPCYTRGFETHFVQFRTGSRKKTGLFDIYTIIEEKHVSRNK